MLFLKKHAFCIKSELLNLDLKIIRFSSFTNFLFFFEEISPTFCKENRWASSRIRTPPLPRIRAAAHQT
jgi:hypothetical protein